MREAGLSGELPKAPIQSILHVQEALETPNELGSLGEQDEPIWACRADSIRAEVELCATTHIPVFNDG